MTYTLDLQATEAEQDALLAWAKELLPFLAMLRRLRLDPSGVAPGLRVQVPGLELELGCDTDAGALRLQFEKVREKVLGSIALPRSAWVPRVRQMVSEMATTAPARVSLQLDGEARFLRVSVEGCTFRRVLINGERLMVVMERLS